jgi:hypothetical protein
MTEYSKTEGWNEIQNGMLTFDYIRLRYFESD